MKSEKLEMINEKKAVRRMTGNRFVRFAIAALALMVMLPMAAMAQDIAAGTVTRTSALSLAAQATDDANASEGWAWYVDGTTAGGKDYTGKVLVLNNANFVSTSVGIILTLPTNTTIVLIGTNNIECNLTTTGNSGAIYMSDTSSTLTIAGNGVLTATGANTTLQSNGIRFNGGGTINITGGTSTFKAGTSGNSNSNGMTGTLNLTGGTVTAIGENRAMANNNTVPNGCKYCAMSHVKSNH